MKGYKIKYTSPTTSKTLCNTKGKPADPILAYKDPLKCHSYPVLLYSTYPCTSVPTFITLGYPWIEGGVWWVSKNRPLDRIQSPHSLHPCLFAVRD